jgi:DNA-binding protein HU-beta
MNKSELIAKIAADAKITKAAAARAVDSFIASITAALKKGEKATFVGFGSFSVSQRKARKGRNPRTGKAIKIPARKVPKFTAGKAFKEAVKK